MAIGNLFRPGHPGIDDSPDDFLNPNSGLPAITDPALTAGAIPTLSVTPSVVPVVAETVSTTNALTTSVTSFAVVSSTLIGTGNFKINLTFDANAQAAGATFEAGIEQAATLLTQALHSRIPVTINMGVGADEAGVLHGSGGAEGGPSSGSDFAYQTVVNDLLSNRSPGDTNFNALHVGTSIQGQSIVTVWNPEQKVLGMLAGNAVGQDGTVTFDSAISSAELTGVALHEIGHALGRVPWGPNPDIFDLFRFTSAGTISFDNNTPTTQQTYFSVNGGTTDLAAYGNKSDPSDYLNSYVVAGDVTSTLTPEDPFDQAYDINTIQTLTAVDLTQLDVLGFSITAACFAAGTMIATPTGETPVEQLRPGDQIRTFGGQNRTILWIGFRPIDLTRHPARDEVEPIRIHAGALSDGIPARDLRVSPEHAMFLDGGLVPARLLVNGASIARETNVQQVTWYHIELESHDLLLAEGAAAETYLDTGNRNAFLNADGPAMLHPRFAGGQQARVDRSCAPFLDEPGRVEPIWRRLAERARAIGHAPQPPAATTGDPALMVRIGDRLYRPILIKQGRYTFALPAANEPAHLVSRAAAPNWHRPWLVDRRVLGVAIGGIEVQRASDVEAIPPDHPDLRAGWWAAERDDAGLWRWTNGDATLPLAMDRPMVVSILVRDVAVYPADAIAA